MLNNNLLAAPTFIFIFLSFSHQTSAERIIDESSDKLDIIGKNCNTDKSSISHKYTSIYEWYFSKLKDSSIKFLEIGFLLGNSARMWEGYFSKASFYFIDIDPNAFLKYSHGLTRSNFFVADQSDKEQLEKFIQFSGGNFDIILDDGGHTMDQQIISFKMLFPHVKSGGVYIIEDLHTSYWKNWGGGGSQDNPQAGPQTTINFLLELVHDLNFVGAKSGCANKGACPDSILKDLSYYQNEIRGIHFYCGICFIFKR